MWRFNDDIHVTESAVVKGSGDDGSELVRISRGGIDGRQASADLALRSTGSKET